MATADIAASRFTLAAGQAALGRSGAGGAADLLGALLFDAAREGVAQDPVTRFLREDAPALDWRTDFLRSELIERMVELPAEEAEIDPAELDVYSKSDLVTTGEANFADGSG